MTDAAHEQRRQRLIGIGLMCGAVAAFACLDCMAKYLGTHMDRVQVVGVRYVSAFLIALLFSNPINRPGLLRTGRPVLQLGRSVLLLGSTVFNFMAFRYLQLDEALAILFSTPFLVAILAGPMLGEWVGWRRWTAIMVGFAGVLVVVAPRPRRLAVGGAALARQRVLLRRLQHHHADAVDHRFQRDHAVLRQPVRLRRHGAGAAVRVDAAAVMDRHGADGGGGRASAPAGISC